MAMTGVLRPVTALLLATAILMLGGGLQSVLLPLRAQLEGFSDLQIGLFGSAFFLGQLIGCLVAPAVISRVGHIRAFSVFCATASTLPLLHAIFVEPFFWTALRLLAGMTVAGILLVIESWLSAASDQETRGRILGAYTLVHLIVVMLGMQLITLQSPEQFELFSMVAVLFSLAAVPVALTATIAPVPPKRAKLRLGWLFYISPAAWLAAFLNGITNGAFWMMFPIYAQGIGFDTGDVAIFMATAVLAGAASQWPIGSLSDRFGRRWFIGIGGGASAAAGLALVVTDGSQTAALYAFIAVFGAANFPLYTLSLAHANDLVNKRRAVEVASSLLMVFSIGAVLGPLIASAVMDVFGPNSLFAVTALFHIAMVGAVLVRVQIRPRIPTRHKEDFVLMPRTTPAIYELDPRAEPTAEAPEPEQLEPAPVAEGPALPAEDEADAFGQNNSETKATATSTA